MDRWEEDNLVRQTVHAVQQALAEDEIRSLRPLLQRAHNLAYPRNYE